jgi:DNA-binding transcriptional LysR family regulator
MVHRDLLDRRIDLLVRWRVGPLTDARLAFDVLYDDSHEVVADLSNRWRKRRKIDLAELMGEPWVLPSPDSLIGSIIMHAFRARGLDWPHASVVTSPHDVRTKLLATGRFLTIFRGSIVRFSDRPPTLAALPVDLGIADVPMGIARIAKRTPSPVAQLFIQHARAVARPLASRRGSL